MTNTMIERPAPAIDGEQPLGLDPAGPHPWLWEPPAAQPPGGGRPVAQEPSGPDRPRRGGPRRIVATATVTALLVGSGAGWLAGRAGAPSAAPASAVTVASTATLATTRRSTAP